MTTTQTRPRSGMRSALAGASALVVVALVVGSDLKTSRPDAGNHQSDAMVERAAVRHLTATLARAMRDLVGPQQPAIHSQMVLDLGPPPAAGTLPAAAGDGGCTAALLLHPALFNLPPPMVA